MAIEKICGIYKIQNMLNGKIYVGQSIDIEDRWRHHKMDLNDNRHDNKHLQYSWNKYGNENFEFTILECCNENKLNELEIYYIDKYDAYINGYNMSLGGYGSRGFKHSEKSKQQMSKTKKNRGLYVGEKNYFYGKRLYGKDNYFYGKHFYGKDNPRYMNGLYGIENGFYGKHHSDETKYKIREANAKPVIQYDKDMNYIKRWDTMKDTLIDGHDWSHIAKCCKGKQKTHHGYIWKYASDIEMTN